MIAAIVAGIALITAAAALALTLVVMRQSADTTAVLRRHRLAHDRAEGYADPEPEAPTPLRGGHRYNPPTGAIPAVRPSEPDPFSPTDHRDPRDTVESPAARPHPLPGQPM